MSGASHAYCFNSYSSTGRDHHPHFTDEELCGEGRWHRRSHSNCQSLGFNLQIWAASLTLAAFTLPPPGRWVVANVQDERAKRQGQRNAKMCLSFAAPSSLLFIFLPWLQFPRASLGSLNLHCCFWRRPSQARAPNLESYRDLYLVEFFLRR